MNTPICDFAAGYARSGVSRLHMPGHKGTGPLGCEALDITEVPGADDLSHPEGVILESEDNATALFGSRHTFYSAGGSSQSIKAMLHLALLHRAPGASTAVLAARNAHKAFLHACALLDLTPVWLRPEEGEGSLCACPITAEGLERALTAQAQPPMAVYVTSPDYMGGMADLPALAAVCRVHGVPLLVDNAHGAYLRFLEPSRHPLDLGAAMCCDSAHKTLPVLTGGAYLHIAKDAPAPYEQDARQSLALFGSSSPSYLILQSLDACNADLAGTFPRRLAGCVNRLDALKDRLSKAGVPVRHGEPLKLTVNAWEAGWTGQELERLLRRFQVQAEYADRDFLVLMFSPQTEEDAFARVETAFGQFRAGAPRAPLPPPGPGEGVLSPRASFLAPQEEIPLKDAVGRVCAGAAVSCPPAIPVVVSGERITAQAAALMDRLGIRQVRVVRDS